MGRRAPDASTRAVAARSRAPRCRARVPAVQSGAPPVGAGQRGRRTAGIGAAVACHSAKVLGGGSDGSGAALERVGLAGRMEQRADRLSGSQQQRVAIARALVQGSRVLLADEPVASLNPETAASVLGLLREISRERGMTVLCSLHPARARRALRGPSDPLPELGTWIWSMMPRSERPAGKLHSTVRRNHDNALWSWGSPPRTAP